MFRRLIAAVDAGGVALVRMNRPPVNAVDQEMYIELARLFAAPDQLGPDVRAVVLAGEGPHFCGGNDLDEFATMTPDNGDERMWRVREAFFAIMDCPVPVIAAVHGVALGTGLAIAASCDIVVAEPTARFGLPELTVGVFGGARHLARIAGEPLVRRMFLTGEQLTAEAMAAMGSAIVVAAPGKALEEAQGYAARVAGFSPTAVRIGKRVLNRIETMDIRAGYEFEQRQTVKMSGHPDSKEALKAFREKRAARFLPRGDV
jgi:enoyl-CoA hydratase/carnithine racemase